MKNFTENKIFRGKKIATQQWVIGYYCPLNEEEALIIDCVDDTVHPYEFVYYKVYADSVGMYIGKDDINGKQMFEGDILKDNNPRRLSDKLQVVAYISDHCYYPYVGEEHRQFEVVGNIIDNPEMSGL